MRDKPGIAVAVTPHVFRSRRRKPPRCPHCGSPGGFCSTHAAFLAGVRMDLEETTKRLGKYGQRSDQASIAAGMERVAGLPARIRIVGIRAFPQQRFVGSMRAMGMRIDVPPIFGGVPIRRFGPIQGGVRA